MQNLAELAPVLRSRNPLAALSVLQDWCRHTPLVRIRATLLSLPPEPRAPIALAVKDILSRYPRTIWGVPLLLYGRRDPEAGNVLLAQPPDGAELIPLRQIMAGPEIPAGDSILANRPQAVLLKMEGPAIDPPKLAADWQSQLLAQEAGGTVHLAGYNAYPWPEAVEASILMQATVQSPREAEPGGDAVFLTDAGWQYAKDTAGLFRQAVSESAR